MNTNNLYYEFLEEVYSFYPKNVLPSFEEYENTQEYKKLSKLLHSKKMDCKWQNFLQYIGGLIGVTDVCDYTTYSFSSPCYKVIIFIKCNGKNYYISFYISMIVDYYAFKLASEFRDNVSFSELESSSLEDKQAFYDATMIDYEKFIVENPPYINNYPHHLSTVMDKIIDCQKKVFGYNAFPECLMNINVPDISTNAKNIGDVTLFDCLFNDLGF